MGRAARERPARGHAKAKVEPDSPPPDTPTPPQPPSTLTQFHPPAFIPQPFYPNPPPPIHPTPRELGIVELRAFSFESPQPLLQLTFAVHEDCEPKRLFATVGGEHGCEEWDRMLAHAVIARRKGGELLKWYEMIVPDTLGEQSR